MDNSPRFDGPYSRVSPGDLEPYERTDLKHADASERPSQQEYDRYLWLVQQMANVGYDDDRVREVVDFRVHDVFMSAIMSIACDVLGGLADELGRDDDAREQRDLATRFADGVASTIDPSTGLAQDFDVRAEKWVATETIAGFAPAQPTAGKERGSPPAPATRHRATPPNSEGTPRQRTPPNPRRLRRPRTTDLAPTGGARSGR